MNKPPLDMFGISLDGRHLIEASAGTGKTYTITGLYLRLILEKSLRPPSILVVTFTDAATEELRERIRKVLSGSLAFLRNGSSPGLSDPLLRYMEGFRDNPSAVSLLADALRSFDEAAIHTIHAFCRRVLADNPFESATLPDTEFITDDLHLVRETVDDFMRRHITGMDPVILSPLMKEITRKSLLNFLKGERSLDPFLRIVPELPGTGDPLEILDADRNAIIESLKSLNDEISELAGQMARIWEREGDSIGLLLLDNPSLNRGTYSPANYTGTMEQLTAYFGGGVFTEPPERLKNCRASVMAGRVNKGKTPPDHEFFVMCDTLHELVQSFKGGIHRLALSLHRSLFLAARSQLNEKKRRYNLRSFDDLLLDLHQALLSGNGLLAGTVRGRYRAALIDEFQDTDSLQYRIFTGLFPADHTLFLIGDPKQAIYGFRGADIFSYMKAMKGSAPHTLHINRRSTPGLISGVNTIFQRSSRPFLYDEISFNAAQAPPDAEYPFRCRDIGIEPVRLVLMPRSGDKDGHITFDRAREAASSYTAAEIRRLLHFGGTGNISIGDRPLAPGDMAVLVRDRYQGAMVQKDLGELGIPAVLSGTDSVFNSPMAVDMEYIIHALVSPSVEGPLLAALSTFTMGYTAVDIDTLRHDEAGWTAIVGRFMAYRSLWQRAGFMAAFRTFMDGEDVRQRILSHVGGERNMTDMLHLAELLHVQEQKEALGIEALLSWYSGEMNGGGKESPLRLESDEAAVKILTIHKSKGLEFPLVFCPFNWGTSARTVTGRDGLYRRYHDPDNDRVLTLDFDMTDDRGRICHREESLAEELRLLYVALTRAKYRAYMVWPFLDGCHIFTSASAAGYLLHGHRSAGEGDALDDVIRGMTWNDYLEDCRVLAAEGGGSIAIEMTGEDHAEFPRYRATTEDTPFTGPRVFTRAIEDTWRITSYSALVRGMESSDAADHDTAGAPRGGESAPGRSVFTFPAGAGAGNCIHDILERFDFTDDDRDSLESLASERLSFHGMDRNWAGIISDMVLKVLSTPLEPGLTLSSVMMADRVSEMPFFLPLGRMSTAGLCEILRKGGIPVMDGDADMMEGGLRGFVDLLFRHEGRYYIVDWKSNLLSDDYRGFTGDRIREEMIRHGYYLQYHLYTVAVHRYLRYRDPAYTYESNFGGVYYLFVRGMNGVDGGTGIFHDRPDPALVDELDRYLGGGND